MRATAETIWDVPAYLPEVQPALTDGAIARLERQIGQPLPRAYLALLTKQNGGAIRFSLPGMDHRAVIAGIGPGQHALSVLDWEPFENGVDFQLQGLVPFDGEGLWQLCLDYRSGTDEPGVVLADIGANQERPIASTFEAYLELLRPSICGALVAVGVGELAALKARLTKEIGARWEPSNARSTGYATDRAGLRGLGSTRVLSISPNRVPRRFVPMQHPRYEQLRDAMPGEADRVPGLPPGAYLLRVDPRWAEPVCAALRSSGVELAPVETYFTT